MTHNINSSRGNIFHITAIIAGAVISRYMRTADDLDTFSGKVNKALENADSITVESITEYDIQYNKAINKGYDLAVNREDIKAPDLALVD